MVEMTIKGIRTCPRDGQMILVLAEKAGDRLIPLAMPQPEGAALATELSGGLGPETRVHALLLSLLGRMGARLAAVELGITAEREVQASVRVDGDQGSFQVEANPIDALVLAARQGSPILMAGDVLDSIGRATTDKTQHPSDHAQERQAATATQSDGSELPAALLAFLATLDLSGL